MLCEKNSNINISFDRCLLDENVTRKLQQQRILSVLNFSPSENELKFCDIRLLLLEIDKACCINSNILLCMSWCYRPICKKSSRSVQWLIVNNNKKVTKGCYGQKIWSWTKYWFDSINLFLNRSCKFFCYKLLINSINFSTTFWTPEVLLFQRILVLMS